MSWPQDGRPRFIVAETVGHWKPRLGGRPVKLKDAPESRTVAVLDRAWCHRVVYKTRSEDFCSVRRAQAVARAQQAAAAYCAGLNEAAR